MFSSSLVNDHRSINIDKATLYYSVFVTDSSRLLTDCGGDRLDVIRRLQLLSPRRQRDSYIVLIARRAVIASFAPVKPRL